MQKIALPAETEAETAAPELLWSYKALLRATVFSYDAPICDVDKSVLAALHHALSSGVLTPWKAAPIQSG